MHFIENSGFVLVSVLGGWLAIQGRMSIGSIQAFIQYMNQFTRPITQTMSIINVFQSAIAAAERVFEFLEEEEEIPDVAQPIVLKEVNGAVDFCSRLFWLYSGKVDYQGF